MGGYTEIWAVAAHAEATGDQGGLALANLEMERMRGTGKSTDGLWEVKRLAGYLSECMPSLQSSDLSDTALLCRISDKRLIVVREGLVNNAMWQLYDLEDFQPDEDGFDVSNLVFIGTYDEFWLANRIERFLD